ncbi:MAG: UDP-N-acetylmuramoyl-L-alanyl-D-glutamate--2,6-diaminopimelate ligase [Cytophagales bacterium]
MKTLKDILTAVKTLETFGSTDVLVKDIQFDSRKVTEGSMFVATAGTAVDGHNFIAKAIELGAKSVVCEKLPAQKYDNLTFVVVENSAKALGFLASAFYDFPSTKMKVVAVTGTNGKTTTATLLFKLFRLLGNNCGLLSTVENKINDETIPSTHTTPDAISMNALMAQMLAKGCTHCFMEASSHAIVQERIAGIDIDGAVFTNITHDHLDYHVTFDNYIAAKKKLFDELPKTAFSLINADDKRKKVMVQNTLSRVYTFGLRIPSDFKGKVLANTLQGIEMDINGQQAWFQLIGDFNAYNILGIYGVAILLGEDSTEVLTALSAITPAPGRFEQIQSTTGITAVVDYAHTPDAVKNVLETLQEFRKSTTQIITVIGCGGDRDKTKRPIMADIACKLSDRVILTSDNPRSEDPQTILNEMMQGVGPVNYKKTISILDRKDAIKTAVSLAKSGDIILIAGKGHEDYQEIKGVKYPFDDRVVVKEMFEIFQT